MSVVYHIDSRYRDRAQYPSPMEFSVAGAQVGGWLTPGRTVQAVRPHSGKKIINLTHNVEAVQVTVPYTEAISRLPFLYVDFSSQRDRDRGLINTISSTHRDAVFIMLPDRVVGYDGSVLINDANDSLDVLLDAGGGGVLLVQIQIPHMNYADHATLAAEIQNQLNTNAAADAGAGVYTWTVTYGVVAPSTYQITSTDTVGAATTQLLYASGPNTATTIAGTIGYDVVDSAPGGDPAIHTGDFTIGVPSTSDWIRFKPACDQTYRFNTNKDAVNIRVFDPNGTTLVVTDTTPPTAIDQYAQVCATFKLTPFFKDGEYDNHLEAEYTPL